MTTKAELKASIADVIKTNTTQDITGDNLQEKIFEVIDWTDTDVRTLATKTTNYTMVNTDRIILADATSNTVTIALPTSPTQGKTCDVFCTNSTFTCTVARNGKNINGAAADQPLLATESVTLVYDTTYGWAII